MKKEEGANVGFHKSVNKLFEEYRLYILPKVVENWEVSTEDQQKHIPVSAINNFSEAFSW